MATIEVNAMSRSLQGTGASRRLRGTGRVPGIIYGAELPAQNVEFEHNGLFHQLKQEAFHASILSMTVDGKKERVLLRDDALACSKIRQLSIAGLLAETILRIFTEDSVSSLFIE